MLTGPRRPAILSVNSARELPRARTTRAPGAGPGRRRRARLSRLRGRDPGRLQRATARPRATCRWSGPTDLERRTATRSPLSTTRPATEPAPDPRTGPADRLDFRRRPRAARRRSARRTSRTPAPCTCGSRKVGAPADATSSRCSAASRCRSACARSTLERADAGRRPWVVLGRRVRRRELRCRGLLIAGPDRRRPAASRTSARRPTSSITGRTCGGTSCAMPHVAGAAALLLEAGRGGRRPRAAWPAGSRARLQSHRLRRRRPRAGPAATAPAGCASTSPRRRSGPVSPPTGALTCRHGARSRCPWPTTGCSTAPCLTVDGLPLPRPRDRRRACGRRSTPARLPTAHACSSPPATASATPRSSPLSLVSDNTPPALKRVGAGAGAGGRAGARAGHDAPTAAPASRGARRGLRRRPPRPGRDAHPPLHRAGWRTVTARSSTTPATARACTPRVRVAELAMLPEGSAASGSSLGRRDAGCVPGQARPQGRPDRPQRLTPGAHRIQLKREAEAGRYAVSVLGARLDAGAPARGAAYGAPVSVPAIRVDGLSKRYGALEAVRGVVVRGRRGEVFALLGPNGAGKTTTVEILEGYRTPRRRRASRCSASTRPAAARACASASGSCCRPAGVYPYLTVARGGASCSPATTRAPRDRDEVLALVGLDRPAPTARAHALRRPAAPPRPRARPGRRPGAAVPRRADHRLRPRGPPRRLGRSIRGLAAAGTTILLTTHYLDEAQRARRPRRRAPRRPRSSPMARPRRSAPPSARPQVRFRAAAGRRPARPRSPGGPPLRPAAGSYERARHDPTGALHALTGWALERGRRARRARGRAAEPRGRLPRARPTRGRRPRVRRARLAVRQLRAEQRVYWRNRAGRVLHLRAADPVARLPRPARARTGRSTASPTPTSSCRGCSPWRSSSRPSPASRSRS